MWIVEELCFVKYPSLLTPKRLPNQKPEQGEVNSGFNLLSTTSRKVTGCSLDLLKMQNSFL